MGADWVASLPMYDFPELREAHDVFWGALADRLTSAGSKNVPRALTRGVWPAEVWGDPSLLFAQGCEYPLAKAFADRVRVVGHPVYSAAGCEGARYRSAIVVRRQTAPGVAGVASLGRAGGAVDVGAAGGVAHAADPGDVPRAASLADVGVAGGVALAPAAGAAYGAAVITAHGAPLAALRGQRCVINELDSNSGMNLLRAAVAPLADSARFFGSVAVSGSHLRSVDMVASGDADFASIDCVSFAHFQRLYPSLTEELRVLSWTASTPSLPFITARSASDATVQVLRTALADVFDDDRLAAVRQQLLLKGVDLEPTEEFREVLALEREAANLGYPILR